MDGPSLQRSIRWRVQLGLWRLPWVNDGEDDKRSTVSLTELYEYNKELLRQQRADYDRLVEALREQEKQHQQQQQQEEEEQQQQQQQQEEDDDEDDVDPLTAMVMQQEAQEKRLQQLELKYRKERARRKRGIVDNANNGDDGDRFDTYSSSLTLGVIEKDLKRLQPDHHTYHHSRRHFQSQQEGSEITFETTVKERTARLTEMLQIYAQQNPHIGYRQGMHEIASYLMLVIEMDLFDQESASPSSSTFTQQRARSDPCLSELLSDAYLRHDAYHMLTAIMGSLGHAYDVKTSPSAESPMESMAQSVLHKIRDVASDKALYDHLREINCPPELYCTRWVRLMFSREVAGWRNVLNLWDIFLDLVSVAPITSMAPNRYTRPGVHPPLKLGHFPLMLVLEACAASMVLLQRGSLLLDGNDSIHTLMNVPPLKNILPLTATLLSMMRRIKMQKRASVTKSLTQMAQNAIPSIRQVFSTTALQSEVPPRARPLEMANKLRESVQCVKNYFAALETEGPMDIVVIPQSVWDALAEVDRVRQALQEQDH